MPKFRKIHVWPDSGFAKRPWWDDPDVDSFARITRGICEAYSQVLPSLGLAARASVMRLDATTWHRPRPALDAPLGDMVEVSARFIGSQEHGWIGVPIGFAHLPIDQKRRLGLRIVHHGVLQLAQALGAAYHGDDLVRMCKTVRWDGSARIIMDLLGTQQWETVIDLSGGHAGVPHRPPRGRPTRCRPASPGRK